MIKNLIFTNGHQLKTGTIFCVASNYPLHAKEMGSAIPDEPSIFIKPPQALIYSGDSIVLPPFSNNVHHEVELVVAIGKECSNVSAFDSVNYIAGYAVGIDATLRDVQTKAKSEGKPWAVAKGFHTSAPVSEFIPADYFNKTIPFFSLDLTVNGVLRQTGNTENMQRSVGTLIEFLSRVFTLEPGDLIFTGTPEGVGQIVHGDRLEARIHDFVSLSVTAI